MLDLGGDSIALMKFVTRLRLDMDLNNLADAGEDLI
jgi:hypothetical protein